jgi:hypothetical protein
LREIICTCDLMVLWDRNSSWLISANVRWVDSSGSSRSSAAVRANAPGEFGPRCSQVRPGSEALAFASATGTLLRHSKFRKRVWLPALAVTGLTGVHFHDLRHAENLLIAHACRRQGLGLARRTLNTGRRAISIGP